MPLHRQHKIQLLYFSGKPEARLHSLQAMGSLLGFGINQNNDPIYFDGPNIRLNRKNKVQLDSFYNHNVRGNLSGRKTSGVAYKLGR